MAVNYYTRELIQMGVSMGSQMMANLFPNDFEWYMVALELEDSQGQTIDYLTFPITPNAITKTEPVKTNIRKSMGGVTVLTSPTFTPQEINIKGNFGRNIKFLISPGVSPIGANLSTESGKFDLYSIQGEKNTIPMLKFPGFALGVKTGYGVIKILQAMLSKSVGTDNFGQPMHLNFYNMALGESYRVVVPPSGYQFSQDLSNNMIWNYNLTLIAVAPLAAINGYDGGTWANIGLQLAASAIQTGVSMAATAATDFISWCSRSDKDNEDTSDAGRAML